MIPDPVARCPRTADWCGPRRCQIGALPPHGGSVPGAPRARTCQAPELEEPEGGWCPLSAFREAGAAHLLRSHPGCQEPATASALHLRVHGVCLLGDRPWRWAWAQLKMRPRAVGTLAGPACGLGPQGLREAVLSRGLRKERVSKWVSQRPSTDPNQQRLGRLLV